jgi:hypothetical protein
MAVENLGHGIMSFDSYEEIRDYMQRAEKEANSRLVREQLRIEAGSYVLQLPHRNHPDLLIVGKTYDMEEFLDSERRAAHPGDPFDEDYSRLSYNSLLSRNYLFGRWHSHAEPAGEYGDVHRSMLGGAIPQWLFERLVVMMGGGEP